VSQATISRLERGRVPAWSTVVRLLACLPEIDVREVLGGGRDGPRAADPHAWRWLAAAHGFALRRAVLTVEVLPDGRFRPTFEVHGLAAIGWPVGDPYELTRMVGAVIRDGGRAMHDLADSLQDPARELLRLETSSGLHEVRLRAGPRGEIAYRWSAAEPLEPGSALPGDPALPVEAGTGLFLGFPCRTLVLRVLLPEPGGRAWPWAHPPTLVGDGPATRRTWSSLYPGGPGELTETGPRRHELAVDFAPPALVIGVDWAVAPDASQPPAGARAARRRGPRARPPRWRSAGEVLREARHRRGLSLRAVGHLTGVSPATLCRVEGGVLDPGLTAVRAVARALSVSPFELLPPAARRSPQALAEIWQGQADAWGLDVEEECRIVRVQDDSSLDIEALTRCVRWRREGSAPPVRFGLGRPWGVKGNRTLDGVTATGGDTSTRVRVAERGPGLLVYDLRSDLTGVSWRRRLRIMPDGSERHDGGSPSRAKRLPRVLTVSPVVPTRKLVIRVKFPPGQSVEAPWARACTHASPTLSGGRDLAPVVHANGWRFGVTNQSSEIRLEVQLPLVGFGYSVGWGRA
jgi:transcriptional regulator with XRE-family HTH domain